jgi:splicing factor 3A subunit 3
MTVRVSLSRCAQAHCVPAINSLFSGEERYGLCLDLYASHTQYNNFRNLPKRLQYLQYLDVLATIDSAPLHSELTKEIRYSKEYET